MERPTLSRRQGGSNRLFVSGLLASRNRHNGRLALREWNDLMSWREIWAAQSSILFALAALFTVTGPFGTFTAMDFGLRFVFWMVVVASLTLLARIADRLLAAGRWPLAARRLAVSIIAALPGAMLCSALHRLLAPEGGPPLSFLTICAYAAALLTLCLVPSARFASLLLGLPAEEKPPEPPAPIDSTAEFLARFAPRLAGSALFAVEAEDHYLRIHTDRGSEMVLMRFRDALGALTGNAGAQVHRGFWVAERGVARIERRGALWQIVLRSGQTIPVSRRYAATARSLQKETGSKAPRLDRSDQA